jgi:hypothetical protein
MWAHGPTLHGPQALFWRSSLPQTAHLGGLRAALKSVSLGGTFTVIFKRLPSIFRTRCPHKQSARDPPLMGEVIKMGWGVRSIVFPWCPFGKFLDFHLEGRQVPDLPGRARYQIVPGT